MLKLFYSPGACSLAPHIALEETGAAYEAVKVSFADGEQNKPEYRAINPKGRVPALATDRGVLTENPAILGYTPKPIRRRSWPRTTTASPSVTCRPSTFS